MARRYRIARIERPPSERGEPLRIAIILSGAVALGSFEAGVICELLKAVERGAPLMIDIIVGSSAGAIIGSLAAKSLVTGVPFEQPLRQWTAFTLQQLTVGYETSDEAIARGQPLDRGILSSEAVRRIMDQYLVADPVERSFQPACPAPRVVLGITLSNLDGLPGTGAPDDENRFTEAVFFRFAPPEPDRISQSPYPPAVWQRVSTIARTSSAFPGAFDPESIPWRDRILIPGLLEELWENESLLNRLHELDPTIQPTMRYADGGILDEQPMERAIAALPLVTGGRGEAGVERLVYDPRRCFLFIEPDPPATSLDALKAGTRQTWFQTFTRALRLFSLSASPNTSQKRVLTANKRQERLLQFLVDLAHRMRDERRAPTVAESLRLFQAKYPDTGRVMDVDGVAEGLGVAAGLVDPSLFRQAIQQFYAWLLDEPRFRRDMAWLDRLPPGRIRDVHEGMKAALLELRAAYLELEGVDPVTPGRSQNVLVEVHLSLAESLGLSQPWVALHEITPDDPRQMLQGEEIIHFGGFFAKEFLEHDFEVGRYYSHLWLKEAVPDYAGEEPERPPTTEDGLNWRLLWRNRGPLWRITGRLVAALLETLGLSYAGEGQLLVKLLGWSLLLSGAHGLFLLVGAWFGWITFPSQYMQLRFWLLMGTSLFPLTFGLLLGLAIRGDAVQRLKQRFGKSGQRG